MARRRFPLPRMLAALACGAPLSAARAAHPLITEDTGTQGAGRFQLELATEHIATRAAGLGQYTVLTTGVLAFGVVDSADAILTVPYLRLGASALDGTPPAAGIADTGIDVKWRFYETGALSFALKPGVSLPTGDEQRNLGTGELSWSLYLVTTWSDAPWAFHLHLGHLHHNSTFNERVDLWHASTAAQRQIGGRLRLILDAGIDTNTARLANSNPTFAIAGAIWSPRSNLDLDAGIKAIHDGARSRALLAGLTFRW